MTANSTFASSPMPCRRSCGPRTQTGRIDYLNRRWTEFTGKPGTVGNDGWGELLHPDEAALAGARWAASTRSGEPFEMQLRLLDRAAERLPLAPDQNRRDPGSTPATSLVGLERAPTSISRNRQSRLYDTSRKSAPNSRAWSTTKPRSRRLRSCRCHFLPIGRRWIWRSRADCARCVVAHQDPAKVADRRRIDAGLSARLRFARWNVFGSSNGQAGIGVGDHGRHDGGRGGKDPRHLRLLRMLELKAYICVPLVGVGRHHWRADIRDGGVRPHLHRR